MPKSLAIAKDFLPGYARLDKQVQRAVDEAFAKFGTASFAGQHLEKLEGARDPRIRTIRLTQSHRGIVLAPEHGETYVLLRALPHDEAYRWVSRNECSVNPATGALEVMDVTAIQQVGAVVAPARGGGRAGELLAGSTVKDLVQLGISEALVPLVRRLDSEAELDALTALLPEGQADALRMLAAGYTIEDAWAELVAGEDPGPVDPTDVAAALGRPASQSTFHLVEGPDELLDILSAPFAQWRVFLHPAQRRLAYRPRPYRGPVRITGGAGTGKTVVAMHRAKALADRLGGGRILFTTFTRNLARAIEENLRLLGGPELLAKVDVLNVDRLAYQVVREAEGAPPRVPREEEQELLWEQAALEHTDLELSPAFLKQEWLQVVLAQGIDSRDEYLAAPRSGRGVRLARRQRALVWKAIEDVSNRLAQSRARTYPQMAEAAARFLAVRSVKPYRHVIVDEAQDLHPAQWRMLRAAVPVGADDLFVVADTHQRIYEHRVTLSRVGIDVRGRSHRLRLNYRGTQEILRWSLGLLTGEVFDDLDDGTETLMAFHSQLHGQEPTARGYLSWHDERAAVVSSVRGWIEQGVPPDEIGVAARMGHIAEETGKALSGAGVPVRVLSRDGGAKDRRGVEVGTMHRMKGLEYRCVAVVDVCQEHVPPPRALTSASEDPLQRQQDLQRERCLLYVACTRARDCLRVSWSGVPSPFLEPLLRGQGVPDPV